MHATIAVAGSIVVVGMVLQSVVPTYEWHFPVPAMMGLAVDTMLPTMYGELSRNAPSGRKGGIMGLASSATLIGNLIGPLAYSAIATNLPLRWVFVVGAMVMALVVAINRPTKLSGHS